MEFWSWRARQNRDPEGAELVRLLIDDIDNQRGRSFKVPLPEVQMSPEVARELKSRQRYNPDSDNWFEDGFADEPPHLL